MARVSNHVRTEDPALVVIGRAGGFVIYDFQRDPDGMILNEGSSDPSLKLAPQGRTCALLPRFQRRQPPAAAGLTTTPSGRSLGWARSRSYTLTTAASRMPGRPNSGD